MEVGLQILLYESLYTKYPEWVNLQRQKADWWLPGAERRGDMRGNTGDEIFFGNENNVLELDRGGGYTVQ